MKKTLAALLSCLFLAAALPQPSLYAAETDAPEDSRITGDVNGDGKRNAADIVLMQQWLLQVPDTTLADWQAGDCNADGRLDGLDLCRMRQLLTAPAESAGTAGGNVLCRCSEKRLYLQIRIQLSDLG